MKKFDLVKLINNKPYLLNNLKIGDHGLIIEIVLDKIKVLFFNQQNIGDYAVIDIKIEDLEREEQKLPNNILNEFINNIDNILANAKNFLSPVTIKNYDMVELVVENKKYTKFGIHKGDRGCIMDNNAIKNFVEVDFSFVDKNGDYVGDCISVDINDLKLVK